MSLVYKISIPNTSRDFFDYLPGEGPLPCVGARVEVPFRKQSRVGLVVSSGLAENSAIRLKSIIHLLDEEPLISPELLELYQWISRYYQAPLSEVIALALPKYFRQVEPPKKERHIAYQLAIDPLEARNLLSKTAKKQLALIELLSKEPGPTSKKSLTALGFQGALMQKLKGLGVLLQLEVEGELIAPPVVPNFEKNLAQKLNLNEEQGIAVNRILHQLGSYHCFLLKGVTGSGKTEVYLQVIEKVLETGKQVLVLVPEIGLTPQLLDRFSARFSQKMVVLHSNLSDKQRHAAWNSAKQEEARIVIGTRSAIFTPLPNLGLIIIDEEHDSSLKQMDGVRYSARDTALMRAHSKNIPIILGSATPSLESLHNCKQSKYSLLPLTQKAMNQHPLEYQILDIRNQKLQHGLAEKALQLIHQHLLQENQVLVFINRRGFSPVLLCHQCGWIADCRACDSHFTVHRKMQRMICHHCGLSQKIPTECKQCSSNELIPLGAGTQRIEEFLSTQFPTTTILRMDRDEVNKKHAWDKHLQQIHSGKAQLIIGTQMLAKGHHFPRLTLVVILDADNGFYNQDFRAIERLGQLLTQVAGRAGRAEQPGQVLIQTHLPHHPLLNLLVQKGYDPFSQELLDLRKKAELPPYHFLALIRAQGKSQSAILQFLHQIKNQLLASGLFCLGPAPAPLARKAGQQRMQLLLKSDSRQKLKTALTSLRQWITIQGNSQGLRWSIDVDPMDLS